MLFRSKSVSLEEVHAKIKIHPRVLQLLEENKFEKLPSPLFVKSFIKSYAEFLQVNPSDLLEAYEREGRVEPEQVLFIKPAAAREKARTTAFDKKWLLLPLGAIALVLMAAGLFFALKTAGSVLWLHKPMSLRSRGETASRPRAVAGSSQPTRSDEWIRSVGQGNFPGLEKNASLKLKIKALDNVWLRVTCDGKVLFQSILKRGSSEVWTAAGSIEIWSGNSSNMVLSLNGFSLGSPGRGVVKKLIVNHQGVKITA